MPVGVISLVRYHRIPLRFQTAPEWDEHTDPPYVDYESVPYAPAKNRSPQPVLKGRQILSPRLDLNDYSCDAIVDWLEFELVTPGKHQALNIQRFAAEALARLGSRSTVYVCGPNREVRYTGERFMVRVQEPCPRLLALFLKDLTGRYAPEIGDPGTLRVLGVEISVDFRVGGAVRLSRDRRNLLRWRIADVLRRHLRADPALAEAKDGAPRFHVTRKGKSDAQHVIDFHGRVPKRVSVELERLGFSQALSRVFTLGAHHEVPIDSTFYVGSRNFPIQLRVMDKRTDRKNPAAASVELLDEVDWRARIEVSLPETRDWETSAAPLGLKRVRDLYGFDYQSMRRLFFDFYLPTMGSAEVGDLMPFPVSLSEHEVFARSGAYGLDRLHRLLHDLELELYRRRLIARKPLRLGKKGRMVSYVALNQKIDRALRGLSRDWERAKHRRSMAGAAATK